MELKQAGIALESEIKVLQQEQEEGKELTQDSENQMADLKEDLCH